MFGQIHDKASYRFAFVADFGHEIVMDYAPFVLGEPEQGVVLFGFGFGEHAVVDIGGDVLAHGGADPVLAFFVGVHGRVFGCLELAFVADGVFDFYGGGWNIHGMKVGQ